MTDEFVYQVNPEQLYETQKRLGTANADVLPNRSRNDIVLLLMFSWTISNQLNINNKRGNAIMNFMKF